MVQNISQSAQGAMKSLGIFFILFILCSLSFGQRARHNQGLGRPRRRNDAKYVGGRSVGQIIRKKLLRPAIQTVNRPNPFGHIVGGAAMEWSQRYGWHFQRDREGLLSHRQNPGIRHDYQESGKQEPVEGTRAWRSQGSFTGDIRLHCLEEDETEHCNYGIVEMFHWELKTWGVMCGREFSIKDANVACKYLGFKRGAKKKYVLREETVPSKLWHSPRFFGAPKCSGNEFTLTECPNAKLERNHTCVRELVAAVRCRDPWTEPDEPAEESCPNGSELCGDGPRCVPYSFVCDGLVDCPWGSDENGCKANCLNDEYWCGKKGGGCISQEFVCDGEFDCYDDMDEDGCETYLNSFNKVENQKKRPVHGMYEHVWTRVTAHICAKKCLEKSNCVAFDYSKVAHVCHLATNNRFVLRPATNWDHYHRQITTNCTSGEFRCRDGNCLMRSLVCNGVEDCRLGEDERECEPLQIRLAGGADGSQGRVEVSKGQKFGLICDTTWSIQEANVVCKQLGYPLGAISARPGGTFTRTIKNYVLDTVECSGTEIDIQECKLSTWGAAGCNVDHEAGVVCNTGTTTPTPPPDDSYVTIPTTPTSKAGVRSCGKRGAPEVDPSAPMAKIVSGSSAHKNEWPWQAGVWLDWTFWCGGSLIHPCWVLSAAHCYRLYPRTQYTVRLGDYATKVPESSEQHFKVARIINHQYDSDTKDNDIALLKISDKDGKCAKLTPSVDIGCLPHSQDQFTRSSPCYVTGWGKLSSTSNEAYTNVLQKAMVPLIPKQTCRDRTEYKRDTLTDNMFCAGFLEGGVDTCQGDSGGPLSCLDDDGRFYIWGIVSWGNGCARARAPGIYTTTVNYIDWIQHHTGIKL